MGQSLEKTKEVADILEFRKRLFTVLIELNKVKKDYQRASLFSDSLTVVTDSLRQILDARILSRAVEKADAERYRAELKLMESEKELNRLRLFVAIATFLFIIITGGLLFNRFRMVKQRQAERAEKHKQLLEIEKKQAEERLNHANELLASYLSTLREKSSLIENLEAELNHLKNSYTAEGLESIAVNMDKLISSTILTDDDWQHFRNLFEQVNPGFLYRLKEKFPDLSATDIRLLILTRLKLSSREMAHMLGITVEAIRKSRYRVRKKLHLNEESSLETFTELI